MLQGLDRLGTGLVHVNGLLVELHHLGRQVVPQEIFCKATDFEAINVRPHEHAGQYVSKPPAAN